MTAPDQAYGKSNRSRDQSPMSNDVLFYVSKLLQPLLMPVVQVLLALAVAGLLARRRQPRWAWRVGVAGFVWLWLCATPLFAWSLSRLLESAHPAQPIAGYPQAECIVVLGGTVNQTRPPRYEPLDQGGRTPAAARLYRAGKAPYVLVSGGVPYQTPAGTRTEADDMADLLREGGVPASALWQEKNSRTTYENALQSVALLREKLSVERPRILLVTSAFHQVRATALFRRQGADVIPVPVGHQADDFRFTWTMFLPDAGALFQTTQAIREGMGVLVFGLLGKLG